MTTVHIFDGNDRLYQRWLAEHPKGFVCNTRRTPDPEYRVLYRSHCHSIRNYHAMAKSGAYTERSFIKVCAGNLSDLRQWVKTHGRRDGSFSKECSFCN